MQQYSQEKRIQHLPNNSTILCLCIVNRKGVIENVYGKGTDKKKLHWNSGVDIKCHCYT